MRGYLRTAQIAKDIFQTSEEDATYAKKDNKSTFK